MSNRIDTLIALYRQGPSLENIKTNYPKIRIALVLKGSTFIFQSGLAGLDKKSYVKANNIAIVDADACNKKII